MLVNLKWIKIRDEKRDVFDMFVFLFKLTWIAGSVRGKIGNTTVWNKKEKLKMKRTWKAENSFLCMLKLLCVNWFHWQSYLGSLDNVHDREEFGNGNKYTLKLPSPNS